MSRALSVIRRWAADPAQGAAFVALRERSARAARWGEVPAWLPASLQGALAARGVERLYSHQAEALAYVRAGQDVVVATPTASGKTLVYNLAALAAVEADPGARALYLFPTKALAHDQVVALDALAQAAGVAAAAHSYDGDTPADARRLIRSAARVVVSNPDMLHTAILPYHDRWHAFFAGLRYVVLDEAHTYRGVFGSHVANVIRRLRRVARFHGAAPQFILSSATIANPAEHAAALIGAPVVAVTDSGAPEPPRAFYIYNPPLVDGTTGVRQSYVQAARRVTRALAREEVPTIVFTNTRLGVERLTRHLREDVARDGGDPERVAGYRGGYLPGLRRAIEAGLRSGHIQTVVSTNALELGMDIGQLEACVLAGYPGTIASTLQRAGRAGRRDTPAVVVLVARSEGVDQYLAANPEALFERNPEHARLAADNLLVVADHVKCAAFELPFADGEDLDGLGAGITAELLGWLATERVVQRGGKRWLWTDQPYPAHRVPLRAIAEGNFTVLDRAHGHRIIGEVDYHSAASTLYPQAIYIVAGDTYQVLTLDWTGRRAEVEPVHVDYYTDAMTLDGVRLLDAFAQVERPGGTWGHGELHVFGRVVGFKKIRFATGENVGYGDVALPESDLHTTGLYFIPDADLPRRLGLTRSQVVDALEGLLAVARHVAAVQVMTDPRDFGGALVGGEAPGSQTAAEGDAVAKGNAVAEEITAAEPAGPPPLPVAYLYERYPGGVGLHEALFARLDVLLDGMAGLLRGCACADGCPVCVGVPAPKLHPADTPRSRARALRLLDHLRGERAHAHAMGEDPDGPARG